MISTTYTLPNANQFTECIGCIFFMLPALVSCHVDLICKTEKDVYATKKERLKHDTDVLQLRRYMAEGYKFVDNKLRENEI